MKWPMRQDDPRRDGVFIIGDNLYIMLAAWMVMS